MSVETLTPSVNTTWRLDVNTAAEGSPASWVQVRSLNSFQPAVNSTVQDASDYDSEGWGSDAVTQRKWQLVATALRKYSSTNEYDPGQEYLRTASDNLALVHVRWYERQGAGNGEAYEGHGLVQWAPQGGDPTGLNSVQVTVLGQGARESIPNPAASSGS
ncbi:phage tail tube protein [Cellulosimicrobium sp. Marseille-Q8652]